MGKAKNAKKHRKRVGKTSEPVQLASHHPAHDAKANQLLTNIGSIHDKKRAEACVLLANLFSRDVGNTILLEKMSSAEILSKLGMRLVDSDETVRLHAAGAIRNMATCRSKSVSQRLVSIGIMGTAISLIMDNLNCDSLDEAKASYVEQLIAAISNLCASCEEAVDEFRKRNFCPSLLLMLSTPHMPSSIQRAAAQCLHITTENQVDICHDISETPGGLNSLMEVAEKVAIDDEGIFSKLHSVGSLTNICGCLPDESSSLTQKMQHMLTLLLPTLEPDGHMLDICVSPTIDDELTKSQQKVTASSEIVDEHFIESTEGTGEVQVNSADEGGEEVYVGGEVDKPWTFTFEVVETTVEILANMAVIIKEQCGSQDEDFRGDYDGVEWEDDDENERRMEAIAALKAVQNEDSMRKVGAVSAGVFEARTAIGEFISVLTKFYECLNIMSSRSDKDGILFSSASFDVMSCSEKVLTALTNYLYLVNDWTAVDVNTLMDLLLKIFGCFATIFRGVTPSSSSQESQNTLVTNLWGLSPLLDRPKLQVSLRTAMSTCACCLATLHHLPMDVSLLALSNPSDPSSSALRGLRMVTLIRGIASIPFWVVTQHCLDVVSFLGSIELQFNEIKVLSNNLLRRLNDPSAIRIFDKGVSGSTTTLCDASILVMEACISSYIDLHSSDDLDIYSVYMSLNSHSALQEAHSDFKNKIREETDLIDREELQQCKETLLNLKRFIKYKATPP